MTVRGTTAHRHAIIQKKIINHDRGGTHVMCAWLDCERDGYELFKVVVHLGAEGYEEKLMQYVFCTERCKQHWLEDYFRSKRNAELAKHDRRR